MVSVGVEPTRLGLEDLTLSAVRPLKLGANHRTRTDTLRVLSALPLPIGLRWPGASEEIRTLTELFLRQSTLPVGLRKR